MKTITQQLVSEMDRSGLSRYQIAKETGLSQATLSRFVRGKQSITLEAADRICAILKLRLLPIAKSRVRKRKD